MFVDLEDFKRYLRMTSAASGEDEDLTEALQAAIELVEHELGDTLTDTDGPRTFTVYPTGAFLLLPVTRLDEVVAVTDPAGEPVDLDTIGIDLLAGVLNLPRVPSGPRRPFTVEVEVPSHGASLRRAVKITAAHLQATSPRGGGSGRDRFTATPGTEEAALMGFALPRRAAQLIATAKAVSPR